MGRKIFIDGGSHIGESVDKFRSTNDGFEYYMFEPNTKLFNLIQANPIYEHHFKYNVALSNKNESDVKLWGGDNSIDYGIDSSGNQILECGATLNGDKKSIDKYSDEQFIFIDTISLSDFIEENFKIEDEIILKLDVEGAEYDIFEDLIITDVIRYVSKVFCEFHTEKMGGGIYNQRENNIKSELSKRGIPIEYWDALN